MSLLSVSALSHAYSPSQTVLRDVSMSLASGETVALLGRSGCGKSTLARLLVGLESPRQGEVFWQGSLLRASTGRNRKPFAAMCRWFSRIQSAP